ncbi:MAG: hypothetical protein JSV20_09920 [Candidatus Bathyarchaeota archaeon]|nr:MAG: hypothetical protein JSV20_09920 [Candidatus Bathyarchaeota archaeon]
MSLIGLQLFKSLGIESIPIGTNIILTGPSGVGKSVFCETLVFNCISEVNVIFITLSNPPQVIRDKTIGQGNRLSYETKHLIIIDAYSWTIGKKEEERYHVSHLSNLNDLSIKIYNAINDAEHPKILIFDSISTLFLYNSEIDITRFIQINMARLKDLRCIGFWQVTEGIHNLPFYNSLRNLTDGVIEMRFEDTHQLNRFLRIHTLKGMAHQTNWIPFTIDNEGRFIINNDKSMPKLAKTIQNRNPDYNSIML